ncbi:hypothetical protein Bbelb_009750 [Branchiostoma belcheri]|nr:hypothetical protein Bbelb_009750 [Branchiostoma belcheri]
MEVTPEDVASLTVHMLWHLRVKPGVKHLSLVCHVRGDGWCGTGQNQCAIDWVPGLRRGRKRLGSCHRLGYQARSVTTPPPQHPTTLAPASPTRYLLYRAEEFPPLTP